MRKLLRILALNLKDLAAAPVNLFYRAINRPLKPTRAVFMVSDRCNSRCEHCSIWSQAFTRDPIGPDEIRKFFSDPYLKNIKYILCTGGEPSVRDDLKEVMLSLHEALPKSTLQLSTNGILPDRIIETVKAVLEKGAHMEVGVSLDGIGEKHDKIRGVEGNFKNVEYLINKLNEIKKTYADKLDIACGIVLSDLTIDSLSAVREFAKSRNVGLVEAWYNETEFYKNIHKHFFNSKIHGAVKTQPGGLVQDKWLKALSGGGTKFRCFAAQTFFVLKANGDIVPCLSKWDDKLGNISKSSPEEIWHSLKAREIRGHVKSCNGCLNGWGVQWSYRSSFYPVIVYIIRHPSFLLRKLAGKKQS